MNKEGVLWTCSDSGKSGVMGVPPSPLPSECLDWRGVCKNGLQNLERLGVRGQNLDNKELAAFFSALACTVTASTMICFLNFAVKVRCHKWAVETFAIRKSSTDGHRVLQPTLRPAHSWLVRRGAGRSPAMDFQRTGIVSGVMAPKQNPHRTLVPWRQATRVARVKVSDDG